MAIGNVVEKLIIEIAGNTDQWKSAVKDVKRGGKDMQTTLKASAKVGAAAFTTIAASATALGTTAVNSFKAFETGVTNVAKTTNLAGKDLDQFKQEIISMSERIPVSTDRLLEIATAAGQLGITGVQDLSKFTETIAKLGATTNVEGESAAITLARLLNITGESISTVDTLGAALVDLGNNFATSEAEILAVSEDVAKAVVQFGLASNEILGISTAMSALGIEAEAGGTVIGKAFQAINEAIRSQGGDAFNKLMELTGMTGEALTQTFQDDAASVFTAFIQGLSKAGDEGKDLSAELAQLNLSGIRVEKILPTLASRSDILADAMGRAGKASKDAAALNDEAAAAFATSNSKLQIAQNKLNNLFIETGETIAPGVIDAIERMTESIRQNEPVIRGLAESFAFAVEKTVDLVGALQTAGRWTNAWFHGNEELSNSLIETREQEKFLEEQLKKRGITIEEFRAKQAALAEERKKAAQEAVENAKKENEAQASRTAAFLQSTSDYKTAEQEKTQAVATETKKREKVQLSANEKAAAIQKQAAEEQKKIEKEKQDALLEQQLEADAAMFDEINSFSDQVANDYEASKEEIVQLDQEKWDDLSLQQQNAHIEEINNAIQHATEMGQLEKASDLQRYRERLKNTQDKEKLNEKFYRNLEKRQERHGKIMGTLIAVQEDSRYQMTEDSLDALSKLQNSKYKEQKEIGKAASIVQIGISTAEAAMKAFNGLAWIPYVGWALGGIAAAAVAGFGLEKINEVRAMKEGGIVPGVGTGDKVPALLEPGELVVPRNMTKEIMAEYNARMMKNGGLATGEKQATDLQETFNKIFSVPQVFKAIMSDKDPDTTLEGFGAQDMAGIVPAMMASLEAAAEGLKNVLMENTLGRMPGGKLLMEIEKATGQKEDEVKALIQDNAATDALKSIIGEEGVYNLFGGSSTLDDLQDEITDTVNDIISGVVRGIFRFQDGGVPGMVSPGEMRISRKALSAIAGGLNGNQVKAIARPVSGRSSSSGGVQKTIVGVELTMNDNLAEFVTAKQREGDILGILNK